MSSSVQTSNVQVAYIPFAQIRLEDRRYAFRVGHPDRAQELKTELTRLGQLHPIIAERMGESEFVILDGYARCDAIQDIRKNGGHWEKVLVQILPADGLALEDRFKILCDKNMGGDTPYGLYEQSLFIKRFIDQGLSRGAVIEHSELSILQIEDHLELAGVDPALGEALNSNLLPSFYALDLVKRYGQWLAASSAALALAAVKKVVRHIEQEPEMSLSEWRFLLDFYWSEDRPFMGPSK